jgi:biotin carboxyl carrier protein
MKPQEYVINGQRFTVEVVSSDGRNAEVRVNGVSYRVEVPPAESPSPDVARAPAVPPPVPSTAPPPPPSQPPVPSSVRPEPPVTRTVPSPKPAASPTPSSENQVVSPMPGTILKVFVEADQSVRAGEPLLILEAMKMENEIHAPRDGTVKKLHVAMGAEVQAGSPLLEFE